MRFNADEGKINVYSPDANDVITTDAVYPQYIATFKSHEAATATLGEGATYALSREADTSASC